VTRLYLRSWLARLVLLALLVIPAAARADIFRSPDHLAFIRLALSNPQIIVHRDEEGKFQIDQCRCPVPVTLQQVSKYVPLALIATEDKDFRSSPGIELKSILRAIFLAHGRQGGSGLHQQIAKNLIVGAAPTLARKAQEALDAIAIDGMFSKDQILDTYLNYMGWGTVDGHSVTGIEQAARTYFGKTAASLDLSEAALLVGMLNGPSRYSPLHHPDRAQERAALVLERMKTVGFITSAQATVAERDLARHIARHGVLRPVELMTVYYTAWVRQALDTMSTDLIGHDRLRVVLGLDPALQANAQRQIEEMLRAGRAFDASQGALVAMDADGLVRAMVGGGSFAESQLDRVTMAHRQPGSAFKPFIYLRALELGRKPTDRVLDAPVDGDWPRNFDRRYNGNVTLEYALAHSLNGATARLAEGLGLPGIVDLAHRMGITSRLGDQPSLALGTYEVTPMELTGAFASIANGGRRTEPHGILAIATAEGDVISIPSPASTQAVSAEHARVLTNMLREVVATGTGYGANYGPGAVGKTGTTQDERDAWFVGFDRDSRLVTGVWVGNDDGTPMHDVTGTTLPAAAWRRFMVASGKVRTQKVMTVSR
jgi:penicillin-binding protein 1A